LKVTATTICGSNPYVWNETITYTRMYDGGILGHGFIGVI
jgi:threonine dehydrogenase-like Zn-dependent dehydrogenase